MVIAKWLHSHARPDWSLHGAVPASWPRLMTARAALTCPRSSARCRAAARSSSSRESSGRPLVVSHHVNRRVSVAGSGGSSSSLPGSASLASAQVRDPSWTFPLPPGC